MSYIWCPKKHGYVLRLLTLVASKRETFGLSGKLKKYLVLDQPNDRLPYIINVSRWGRVCDFERRVRIARRPVFVGWHNIKMFVAPLVGPSFLYASVLDCWSNLECRRDMHLPSTPLLTYLSHEIFVAMELTEAVWRHVVPLTPAGFPSSNLQKVFFVCLTTLSSTDLCCSFVEALPGG